MFAQRQLCGRPVGFVVWTSWEIRAAVMSSRWLQGENSIPNHRADKLYQVFNMWKLSRGTEASRSESPDQLQLLGYGDDRVEANLLRSPQVNDTAAQRRWRMIQTASFWQCFISCTFKCAMLWINTSLFSDVLSYAHMLSYFSRPSLFSNWQKPITGKLLWISVSQNQSRFQEPTNSVFYV